MIKDKLTLLGARLFGEKAADVDASLNTLDALFYISTTHRAVLADVGGAIVFDRGARFTMNEPSPLNSKAGYQRLELLYGLGNGKDSLKRNLEVYRDELPPTYVPIGEAPGGNLLSLDGTGCMHLWDHESLRGHPGWKVSDSFDDFFQRLEPEDSGPIGTEGIIDSESLLDF